MRLLEIANFFGVQAEGDLNKIITGIQYDSRKIKPGDIFVCIKGLKSDGHDYIPQAVENGAAALLVEHPISTEFSSITQIVVNDTRKALALFSSYWFGFPSRKLRMIGVTGTNGKTTTTHLIKGLLEIKKQRVGLIGTIHNLVGDEELPATHTTPESLELTELLDRMVKMNSRTVVMEVSSHALKQNRVAGCEFDVGVFTNLTQDHLDYHPTWEDYLNSKLILFSRLGQGEKGTAKYAVVNADDQASGRFIKAAQVPVWTYGINNNAMIKASNVSITSKGTKFLLTTPQEKVNLSVPLTGMFNVSNILAAVSVGLGEGLTIPDIAGCLSQAPQVAGRFEQVREGQPFSVIVDYAHTPDGLENILATAREITSKRLITVFGCGGDRDQGKRPIMGEISGRYSNYSIVTSDNPRTEDPEKITAQIEKGISQVTRDYRVVLNRRQAIIEAISMGLPGDTIVIAGKGHETYQLVNGEVLHFDDREVAREALKLAGYASNR
ncbi:MAG: UDP-N-acetylmuramoyl-L-alanyl-D-glutamate--2,6-diaminopimelate ligase [Clostridia bacterium]|jgi:UDP-N-acetylmuramoyl-L-alanyl-D-glutamate--2,6-diaminopimelate ligase|nr:UDP-N-acetylmuramoyl-L-alanyl-D-glutamate--2,6-diaminopimelate ligase [Clostridia bacterium]